MYVSVCAVCDDCVCVSVCVVLEALTKLFVNPKEGEMGDVFPGVCVCVCCFSACLTSKTFSRCVWCA